MKICAIALAFAGLASIEAANAESDADFQLLTLDGNKVKWSGTVNTGVVITYALVDEAMHFAGARNCAGLVPIDGLIATSRITRVLFEQEVAAAFSMWAQVADVVFRPTRDATTAGILIGAQQRPVGHAFTNVDYRTAADQSGMITRSLICLNPDKQWKVGFGGSAATYDVRYTVAHEIGHAIGLDHPDSSGQLMSFAYQERFRMPQAGDIDGIQRLYGEKRRPSFARQLGGAEQPALQEAEPQGTAGISLGLISPQE